MFRAAAILILAAASSAVAASSPLALAGGGIDEQLQQARRDASQAEAEQARLEKAAASARDAVTQLRAQQLAAAQAIVAAEARISAAETSARAAEARVAAQQQRLAAGQAPVSSLLAGLALMARRPPVLTLADGGSVEELVKLKLLLRSTVPAVQARTASLARDVSRAEQLQRAASAARKDALAARNDLVEKRRAFALLEAKATKLASERGWQAVGAGDVALASREEFAQLQRRANSSRQASAIARELAALGPAPLLRQQDAPATGFDYRLPAEAAVTDGFGEVSANGIRSRGVTLATRRGARMVAPAGGTILFAGPFRDYDGVIILDHGGGWMSVLVNAGSRMKRGDRIEAGEPLGTALGPLEIQLQHEGVLVSPAIIAGSSQMLSNGRKGG